MIVIVILAISIAVFFIWVWPDVKPRPGDNKMEWYRWLGVIFLYIVIQVHLFAIVGGILFFAWESSIFSGKDSSGIDTSLLLPLTPDEKQKR